MFYLKRLVKSGNGVFESHLNNAVIGCSHLSAIDDVSAGKRSMYGTRMAARIDQKCADRHRTDFPFSPAMAILEHDRRLENIRLFSFEIVRIEQAIGRTTNCQI